jgi:hypothetical protein
MATSIIDALDFRWNHTNDFLWQLQFQKLPLREKICKVISDYAVYIFAYILGADDLTKLGEKKTPLETKNTYDLYINKHNSYLLPYHKSIILILNGEGHIATSPETFQQLEDQSQCKIVFHDIRKLEDIAEIISSLRNRSNQIRALWIRAHATPETITFHQYEEGLDIRPLTETEQIIGSQRIEKTKKILQILNQLEPDAPIILESCSTGQKMEEGKENIAQFISRAAGGRKVYAPTREALVIDKTITYTKEKGFNVVINGLKSSTYFSKGSLMSRITAVWHAYRNHQEEITCEY